MSNDILTEIQILEQARDAIIHGIDSNGLIVSASSTPSFGGYESGEDFYVYTGLNTGKSINVYVPFLEDDTKFEENSYRKPYVEVTMDVHPAGDVTFNREVFACTVNWSIALGMNDGSVSYNAATYKNEKACLLLQNRLRRVMERHRWDSVELLKKGDAEPTGVYMVPDDNRTFRADVSMYLEYWPEIDND